MTRAMLALAAILSCAAAGVASAKGQQPASSLPTMSTTTHGSADSLYATVLARLQKLGYRIWDSSATERRFVVRGKKNGVRVQIQVVTQGDSTSIAFATLGNPDMVAAMSALIMVTHDATMEPLTHTSAPLGAESAMPVSRWRTQLFVSPHGRLWSARGGIFTADSLPGPWRLAFGAKSDPVDPDRLAIGTLMAFVSPDTLLVASNWPRENEKQELLFRTTNGGAAWSVVPVTAGLANMDDAQAQGNSVWVFADYFAGDARRSALLHSADGGTTWTRPDVPAELYNVTHLYRTTPFIAYAATAGSHQTKVFWRTTDGGNTWFAIPTPKDQKLNEVPSDGVRIEEIAVVGRWLVVREYGKVFVSATDSIHWRAFKDVNRFAADRERDQLFVLTSSMQPMMLDRDFAMVWQCTGHVPSSFATDVEQLVAHDGVGYVSMLHGEVYQAQLGKFRVQRPNQVSPTDLGNCAP